MGDQLKAYAVTEESENTGAIIFAAHNVVARREGANEYADGEFSLVSCCRAKWADAYAETRIIPASVMVDNGWSFECVGCGTNINSDLAYDDGKYEGWTTESVVGSQHSAIFCQASCEDAYRLFEAERSRRQDRAIERFKKIVQRRFPGVTFPEKDPNKVGPHHAYAARDDGRWSVRQVFVSFEFPGMRIAPAQLRFEQLSGRREKPYWSCCSGDREAFEAFAAAVKPAAPNPLVSENG